ncbi:MAG: hypothetical protein A2092_02680 [Rhodobacteraceae bacterium GWE1_64_9]|nr:MAG: hypothetical protein A2092_02680 [Rhodobacteraceae bacterium GWE1_64_9]OHC47141.1 MAG: hypothetical protein A2X69_09945 [Rhodobacteraceae bacterium GWF1_65_7]
MKYLITSHSKELKRKKLVVSRFEFMKFLKQWEKRGKTRNEALLNYLSFIHARDLVLDRFFDLRDCSKYEMNFAFSKPARQAEEVSRIAIAMRRLAPVVGVRDEDDFVKVIETVLHAASLGNAELMRELKQQPPRLRVLLVGALWEDRTVVTVFDGLDSLDVHDALQESDRWSWVKYLVENRAELSSPTELRLAGEVNDCDSILVLRRNTAAQLEFEYNKVGRSLDFESVYTVAPVDGLAATLSVTQRAAKTIIAADPNAATRAEEVTFDLMRVAQRTMIAISRNGATRVNAEILYNLFAGDLREQFRFLSVIFDWSVKEMLSLGYLDTEEYFDSSPLKLIHALASTRGNDFLARKSYRVVELLLNPEGGAFENAAKVVVDASGMTGDGKPSITPVPNLAFSGHFDNVFNYLDHSKSETIDHHSFLKKLRAVQLLSEGDMSFSQFSSSMERTFGYSPVGAKDVVLFLLQTEFASAHVVYRNGIYDILLSSTAKGALCIKSLVFNLAYLENVFHCTLFPSVLVSHVSDKERSISVTDWAAASIRNAFIFLSYFALIENNDAYGKPVPERYRLLSEMREKIIATVLRIVESRGTGDRIDVDSERIAVRSLELIKKTREQWRMARVLL